MASDRGSATLLDPSELEPAWFDCDRLHLSGYALLREPAALAALRAVELARGSARGVSVDLSSWSLIDEPLRRAGREPPLPTSCSPPSASATAFGALDTAWVVKRGALGVDRSRRGAPRPPDRGRRPDRRRRCVRRRLPRRRGRARPRSGGSVLREARSDAVIRIAAEVSDALAGGRRRGRARDDARRAWVPTRRGGRGRASPRSGPCAREDRCRRRSASSTVSSSSGSRADELARFDLTARKLGPRDLAAAIVQGAVGATTVGGTLAACRAVGVSVLATGGLGGVHRGWPTPPDVSADLDALARTPVLVVSSGVKSLLDVPATAELMETLGVPVLGWRTEELPLFYTARGGPPVSARVETAAEAARIARAHWKLGGGGLLLGRPPERASTTSSR